MNVLSTGGCGGPLSVVPASPPQIFIQAGSPPVGTSVYGNDCISPANTYYNARLVDSTGKLVIQEAWRITGSVVNLANVLAIVSPLSQPITLNGDVTGDVTQSIVSRCRDPALPHVSDHRPDLLYNGTCYGAGNTAGTGNRDLRRPGGAGIFTVSGSPITSAGTLHPRPGLAGAKQRSGRRRQARAARPPSGCSRPRTSQLWLSPLSPG